MGHKQVWEINIQLLRMFCVDSKKYLMLEFQFNFYVFSIQCLYIFLLFSSLAFLRFLIFSSIFSIRIGQIKWTRNPGRIRSNKNESKHIWTRHKCRKILFYGIQIIDIIQIKPNLNRFAIERETFKIQKNNLYQTLAQFLVCI